MFLKNLKTVLSYTGSLLYLTHIIGYFLSVR